MPCVRHLSIVASNPPGENINSAGPWPSTSYRVSIPSTTALATLPLQVLAAADVLRQRLHRLEADLRNVGVALGRVVDCRGEIAESRVDRSHAAGEPGTAAEATDHGNRHGGNGCRTCNGTRVREVEHR